MDVRTELLERIKELDLARGNFLGLLNLLIGRQISKSDGTLISSGFTWRELAAVLKKAHWDKAVVTELKQTVTTLPPRDRERFWYCAIAQAHIDSKAATEAGDRLALALRQAGYVVGDAPGIVKQA